MNRSHTQTSVMYSQAVEHFEEGCQSGCKVLNKFHDWILEEKIVKVSQGGKPLFWLSRARTVSSCSE